MDGMDACYFNRRSGVVCELVTTVIPAKMADLIDISFGVWIRVAQKENFCHRMY